MDGQPKNVQQESLEEVESLRRQLAHVKPTFTQFQQSLHSQQVFYQTIVEDQTDLICRFKPDGTLTFVNPAYCRYFSKTSVELVNHSFMPLISAEDRDKVKQALATVTPATPVTCVIHQVMAPDGQQRQFRWINRGIYNEANELVEYQAMGRDITFEAEARSALERRAKRLQILYAIAAQTDQPVEIQLNHALRLSTQFLGMAMGVISHVTGQADNWQFVPEYVYVTEGACPALQSYPLGQTYCEVVLQEKRAIAIAHVSNSAYRQHHCHMATGVEAYIGVPVLVGGEQYGALSFTSSQSKLGGFFSGDIEFVELLAFWIGAALRRRNDEAELLLHRYRLEKLVEELIAKTLPSVLNSSLAPDGSQVAAGKACKPFMATPLTERERDVLQSMVAGLNNAQIANELLISIPTVKYHICNLLDKLGVANRTEAVVVALREGLVKPV